MSSKKETFSVRPFEKLRKNLECRTTAVAPPRQKKKEELTEDELFDHAMDDVHVNESFRALSCCQHHSKQIASSIPRDPDRDALVALEEIAAGHRPINLPDTQEYVEWTNPDYPTVVAKLHQGQFSVQAFLDLHGYSVPEAKAEMEAFLGEASFKGHHCVKIIHGRGLRSVNGPRIKDLVIRLLLGRYRSRVVAYASARQCDGGLGAVYVLLKKR